MSNNYVNYLRKLNYLKKKIFFLLFYIFIFFYYLKNILLFIYFNMNDNEMSLYLTKHKIKNHISPIKIKDIYDTDQTLIDKFNLGGRPNGMWYSIGGNWLKFLIDNEAILNEKFAPCCFIYKLNIDYKHILKIKNPDRFKYKHYWLEPKQIVRGAKRLKELSNKTALKKLFTRSSSIGTNLYLNLIKKKKIYADYNEVKEILYYDHNINASKKEINYYKYPRWDLIATQYDGVEFPNFKATYKYFWYDSIDVSSGCIWNIDAIKSFELLAIKKKDLWHIML